MLNAYELSRTLHVLAALGVADLLVDGPRDVAELAAATASHPPSLHRLLRAAASVGVFAEDAAGRFGLTPRAEFLRSDVHGSLQPWAMLVGSAAYWSSWSDLLQTVITGEPAFPRVHGMTNWQHRERHPEQGTVFDRAMTANSATSVDAIARGYDFSQFSVVADVGGGHGVVLAAILAANPTVRGILFDQPHVVMQAERASNSSDVGDRLQIVGGDFFEQLPVLADAYMLKSVLHDWDDASATRILGTCRAAMAHGAKLLVIEQVVLPFNAPDPTKFLDVRMLVIQGGRERTADEFRQLYAAAGFHLDRIISTRSPLSIIEGSAA